MKPDDIPQDVWERAEAVTYDISPDGYGGVEYQPAHIAIARAIQAAKAEAYEEAAGVCEDYESDLRSWDGPTERSIARASTDYACIDLAAAIRKLGEK